MTNNFKCTQKTEGVIFTTALITKDTHQSPIPLVRTVSIAAHEIKYCGNKSYNIKISLSWLKTQNQQNELLRSSNPHALCSFTISTHPQE